MKRYHPIDHFKESFVESLRHISNAALNELRREVRWDEVHKRGGIPDHSKWRHDAIVAETKRRLAVKELQAAQ